MEIGTGDILITATMLAVLFWIPGVILRRARKR